jgi:hypothetical protein
MSLYDGCVGLLLKELVQRVLRGEERQFKNHECPSVIPHFINHHSDAATTLAAKPATHSKPITTGS